MGSLPPRRAIVDRITFRDCPYLTFDADPQIDQSVGAMVYDQEGNHLGLVCKIGMDEGHYYRATNGKGEVIGQAQHFSGTWPFFRQTSTQSTEVDERNVGVV